MKGQDLKHRMNGAKETVKITRAMQLISASKMIKTEKRMEKGREFLRSMEAVVDEIGNLSHPFYRKTDGDRTVFIVVAGDKGLCGDYNHKVLDVAEKEILSAKAVRVYAVGQYCRDFLVKRNIRAVNNYIHMLQEPFTKDAQNLTNEFCDMFLNETADKVKLIYTSVPAESRSAQVVAVKTLLPIQRKDDETENDILEYPNDATEILKQFIWAEVYHALCCAGYAVNFKRMSAMQQATTNGEKLVNEISSKYNHLRQESITTELLDAGIAKIAVRSISGDE